jgi:CHAD domain-containing protein
VRKELRVAGKILGSVRDLDVFRMGALHWQRESGVPLPRLAAAWDLAYDSARADLEQYLEGPHRAALATALGALAATPAGNGRGAGAAAAVLIATRHHEMHGFQDLATTPNPAYDQLHRLRIAAKRLRYVLEFFSSILGPEAMATVDELRMLQDHLGALQDAVVARDLVRGFLANGELAAAGSDAVPDLLAAPGMAAYLDALDETIAAAVAAFPDVWGRITGPEFGTLLTAAVAPLEAG